MNAAPTTRPTPLTSPTIWLQTAILAYAAGRICQLGAGRLPTLLIVILHVLPPAALAVIHGSIAYTRRGIAVFTASCLGLGSLAELISMRTGFPFGNYHFTQIMGPKLLGLPLLLALAYLGIGYVSWTLALLISRRVGKRLRGKDLLAVPLLAATIMTAWDLAMDPFWSTLHHVWIWHHGGRFLGVPISNFAGWFLTATLYYFTFAMYTRTQSPPPTEPPLPNFWSLPAVLYLICALGNLLVLAAPLAPPTVTDPSGRRWRTSIILAALAIVSMLIMTPFALLALHRARSLQLTQETPHTHNPAALIVEAI